LLGTLILGAISILREPSLF